MDFQRSLDAGPLYAHQHFDPPAVVVSEACRFIRRAASAARIEKSEYLASLVMYYLLVQLHQESGDSRPRSPEAFQMRRWSFIGASAALSALQAELGEPMDSPALLRLPSEAEERAGPADEEVEGGRKADLAGERNVRRGRRESPLLLLLCVPCARSGDLPRGYYSSASRRRLW